MSRFALHPIIHVDHHRQVDCMICGRRCDPKRRDVYSNSEGYYPVMYFHAHCGTGKTGEELHGIYFREVEAKFRNGGRPLMLS